jgi:hypothetical protein
MRTEVKTSVSVLVLEVELKLSNVRFDADMTRCIQRIVDEDCTLSLRAINTELRR